MIFRLSRPASAAGALLLLTAALLAGCGPSSSTADLAAARDSVTALGRIVPGRAVINVGAPTGERLATQSATEGLKVAQGDILATLATCAPRQAELEAARIALAETRRRFDAETALGQANILRAQAALGLADVQLDHARREFARVQKTGDAATVREGDEQAFQVKSGEQSVALAHASLEVAKRTLDQTLASLGLDSAAARVRTLEASVELGLIRAPIAGTVLKVFGYPGELTGTGPVFQLGATDDMQVIAEVQAEDIGFVKAGQTAIVTSRALGEPARGTVIEVGELIYKNDVLDLDPRAPRDTRVVEVRIRLSDGARAAKLTNLEVDVRIQLK